VSVKCEQVKTLLVNEEQNSRVNVRIMRKHAKTDKNSGSEHKPE